MFKEFKEFIANGSVMDAAIGFVMGLAFKSVIDGVVNDILMPIIGYLTAGVDFNNLKIVLKEAVGDTPEVAITYGHLIQTIITFLLVALFMFLVVKALNKARKAREAKKAEEEPEEEEEAEETELDLLKDIRTLLNKEENQ